MNELRPHGRELLEAARRERTLGAAERARLLNELLAAAQATDSTPPHAARLGVGSKALLLAALAAAIALMLYLLSR